ncbi:upstream activation factor subunit spp27 [Sitophilus oryzae]|uniref:Upstream activation factor subunit spp27 n=1 Tax=Sitophilus oryzae TaxID=7048 RepID=A0A6J2Y408_SITOR|nr:upstream activation factor subunit spp27 [Sitophilus oryzae]
MADISKEDLRKEIAAILKDADLASTSAKKVRQELEEKLDVKLQARKKEIDDLVMEFVSSKKEDKKKKKNDSEDDGGEDEEEEEEEEEEEDSESDKKKKRGSTSKKPPAKKTKKDSEEESGSEQSEGDSEEEYSPKKAAKPAKTRKLPPKKKKGSESDSDEDWGKKKGGKKGGGGAKKGSGYTKQLQLSPELAALVGAEAMARHEVVKKMWSIIKEKNLYDPKNKQYAICDDALLKVIGTKRFRTFGMMKYLKNHFIS